MVRRRAEVQLSFFGSGWISIFSLIYWKHLYWVYLVQLQGWGRAILAMGAVGMLSDTVNALYFATSVEALSLTFDDIVVGIVLGLI